jgi:DNA-binding NarL/FixJ family response regulator
MKRKIKVLIADDNLIMRKTLSQFISESEFLFKVGEASNGEEAIALAKQLSPDIILMDISMSPVNGFEATRKILKSDSTARIIGLSMHKEASYARNMLNLGARGYVTKSSLHEEIIGAIIKVNAGEIFIDKNLEGEM